MGAGGSVDALPDVLSEEACKAALGDKFDAAKFEAMKDEAGNVSKEKLVAAIKEAAGGAGEGAAAANPGGGRVPNVIEVSEETKAAAAAIGDDAAAVKAFHSAIRWNKPVAELTAMTDANAWIVNSVDAQNGNWPLHLSAQNGHREVTSFLISKGANVNCQNGSGHTPLHMAREYGYFFLCRDLTDNGADRTIANGDGHPADKGNEGGQNPADPMPMFTDASSGEELDEALACLATHAAGGEGTVPLDKATLIQGYMGKKRSLKLDEKTKDLWTGDRDKALKAVIAAI